jgi:RNase P subunit RPR2
MAFRFFREYGLAWTHDDLLVFLGILRSTVPEHLLSDADVRKLLEDQRSKICPECETPLYSYGISFDAGIGSYALFSCGKCNELQRVQTKLISKTKGVDVICNKCGANTHFPASVWCKKCGEGFPKDWKSKLSRKS